MKDLHSYSVMMLNNYYRLGILTLCNYKEHYLLFYLRHDGHVTLSSCVCIGGGFH